MTVVWGGTEWTDGGTHTRKGGVKSEARRRVHRTNGRTNGGSQKSGEIEEKRRGWRGREGEKEPTGVLCQARHGEKVNRFAMR